MTPEEIRSFATRVADALTPKRVGTSPIFSQLRAEAKTIVESLDSEELDAYHSEMQELLRTRNELKEGGVLS